MEAFNSKLSAVSFVKEINKINGTVQVELKRVKKYI